MCPPPPPPPPPLLALASAPVTPPNFVYFVSDYSVEALFLLVDVVPVVGRLCC